MSVELLYTSAPQGLKQGSRGFCTVVSTAGMPINLAQRLESLSGYRHVYPPQDAKAADNPICYSHLRLTIGGRTVSILSRISAYGVDYSQRTNKLAHHVVLDQHEQPLGGPSSVLSQPGIMRSNWSGQCETPHTGPTIAARDVVAQVCRTWANVTGDAGWAGVVADAWLQPTSKTVWIIFSERQSQNLLPMLDEAVALLPTNRRWNATFSTYYTSLPPDIDCRVRCVLQGTDEARMAVSRGVVIDLTKPMPPSIASPTVLAAREGHSIVGIKPPSLKLDSELIPQLPNTVLGGVSTEPLASGSQYLPSNSDDEIELQLASLQSVPPRYKGIGARSSQEMPPFGSPSTIMSLKSRVLVIVSLVAILLTAGGLGVTAYFQKQSKDSGVSSSKKDERSNKNNDVGEFDGKPTAATNGDLGVPNKAVERPNIPLVFAPEPSIEVTTLLMSVEENIHSVLKLATVKRINTKSEILVQPDNIFEVKNKDEIWLRGDAQLNFENARQQKATISCENITKTLQLNIIDADDPHTGKLEIIGGSEIGTSLELKGVLSDEDAKGEKPEYVWKWSYDGEKNWTDIHVEDERRLPLMSWMNGKWIGVAPKYKAGVLFVESEKVVDTKPIIFKAIGKIDFDKLCGSEVQINVEVPAQSIETGVFAIRENEGSPSTRRNIVKKEFEGLDEGTDGIHKCKFIHKKAEDQVYLRFSTSFPGLKNPNSYQNKLFTASANPDHKNALIDFGAKLREAVQAIERTGDSEKKSDAIEPGTTVAFKQKQTAESILEICQSVVRLVDQRQTLQQLKEAAAQNKTDKNKKEEDKPQFSEGQVAKLKKLEFFFDSELSNKLRALARTVVTLTDFRASVSPNVAGKQQWLYLSESKSPPKYIQGSLASAVNFDPSHRIDLSFEAIIDIPDALLKAAKKIAQ